MRGKPSIPAGLLWVLVLIGAGCIPWSPRVRTTEEKDLAEKAQGIESLVVETRNGRIKTTGAANVNEISIHVVKMAGGRTKEEAAECMRAIQVESKVEDKTLRLGWKWVEPRKKTWQASVSFEIELPRTIFVNATTHNGGVELADMESPAVLETHNGSVTVENVQGNLKIRTHNGRVDVTDHTGDLLAETSNGGVKVRKPGGQVEVKTHNGKIDVEAVTSKIEASTHNGSVRLDLSGSKAVNGKITTSNGSVAVRTGSDASARLTCSTSNGRIRIERDMETTVRKKRRVEGTVGGGEGTIEIRTSNGSITLE